MFHPSTNGRLLEIKERLPANPQLPFRLARDRVDVLEVLEPGSPQNPSDRVAAVVGRAERLPRPRDTGETVPQWTAKPCGW